MQLLKSFVLSLLTVCILYGAYNLGFQHGVASVELIDPMDEEDFFPEDTPFFKVRNAQ
jgi:hypothetical protein